jgi:hypothetical protein
MQRIKQFILKIFDLQPESVIKGSRLFINSRIERLMKEKN